MIGRLNHVAIAVRDIGKAAAVYRDVLGADVSAAVPQPDHGVTTVFITLPNTKIELLEPLGEGSPIAKFLERNPDGGMHHVCYEVDNIGAASEALKKNGARVLGADVSAAVPQPEHGVTTVFITLPNTKIELLEPLGEGSPIAKFLERNPDGGMHHVCYEVDDIHAASEALKKNGARVLGDGQPKIGAHGKPVLFLHPKDFSGTLVELEQR